MYIAISLFTECGANYARAPSYFSHFFAEQLNNNTGRAGDVRTLYIDRDPDTFRDIALHLQGYHVAPRDGEHYVKLFADAQFYSRKCIDGKPLDQSADFIYSSPFDKAALQY